MMTVNEFCRLGEDARLQKVVELRDTCEPEEIIDFLLSVGVEKLSGQLLGELARAYNNSEQQEEALAVLDMVPEEDRDAVWYYRCGYAHWRLSEDWMHDGASESRKALEMLNQAVERADGGSEVVEWCVELVALSDLKKVLKENYDEDSPLCRRYVAYAEKNIQEMEAAQKSQRQEKYIRITVEDIRELEDSWEIAVPIYDAVNIYDSYAEYLESAKPFTTEQRYLLAVTWYFAEVNNGGHHQFFFNSTGIVWEDALDGFKLFGMNEFARNFENVIEYMGGTIPFDRAERWDLLEKLEAENEDAFSEVLDKADDFVYQYEGEETELTFIKENPEKFVFEGCCGR